jgi:Zn-dependent protease with chaperone function
MPYLLLLLLVGCLQVEWQRPPAWLSPTLSVSLTWLCTAAVVGFAVLISIVVRRILTRDPGQREAVLRRYLSWRFYHFIALGLGFGISLYLFGWGWLIQDAFAWGTAENGDDLTMMLPGSELLLLAPFFAGLICSWTCFYDAELALHGAHDSGHYDTSFWSRGAYLAFQARNNLGLVSVLLLLLVLLRDLLVVLSSSVAESSVLPGIAGLAIGLLAMVCMPWAFRLILGLKPLAEGPLRQRLLASACRLNFRFSNILLWNTRGGVANAMLIGVLPMLRYVVFTDRLLTEMSPDEIDAVFGHEVGHVKHRHIPYYLGFFALSLAIVSEVWEMGNLHTLVSHTLRRDLAGLPLLTMIGAYIFVVFGFLSRRCERQADIYGCRAVSCARADCSSHESSEELALNGGALCRTGIHIFIGALEKVAYLNGISRDKPGWLQSWQHSTIARRVDFLQRVMADPTLEPRFQQRVTLVKWLSMVVLGGVLFVLGQAWGWANLLAF